MSWFRRLVGSCWARKRRNEEEEVEDTLLWSRDLASHAAGEYSFAVVQANRVLEDHSQVETGTAGTFVGVYDGHGGADASIFVREHLFNHLMRLAQESGNISEQVIKDAFAATEDEFLAEVQRTNNDRPNITASGTCCLTGLIWKGTLYVANLGDSRAVVGYVNNSNSIIAYQLTTDDNAKSEAIRRQLHNVHPEDSSLVIFKNGAWRVKGVIQVTKSIGDGYLKKPELSVDRFVEEHPHLSRFQLSEPLRKPVLSAVPDVRTRVFRSEDRFLIFASDGLWEHLSNHEAANIVHSNPRAGIAKRLLQAAMQVAAEKQGLNYEDIKMVDRDHSRRHYHDDITVVVIFIDHAQLSRPSASVEELSVRGFNDTVESSSFSLLNGMNSTTSGVDS